MAKTKIITAPNPILRQKSKPVKMTNSGADKKTRKLATALINTVQITKEPKGVGLSAVQIGKPVRIFVIKQEGGFVPFINPKITWQSKKKISQKLKNAHYYLEGCLSVPGYYGFVDRPYTVRLKWQDLERKNHQGKFEGKQSAYIQHEYDHLEGILFIDRILEQGGKIYKLGKNEKGGEELVEVEI